MTLAYVTGSSGESSKRSAASERPGRPRQHQSQRDAHGREHHPLAQHEREDSRDDAPSAERTPISRVRSVTLTDRTP